MPEFSAELLGLLFLVAVLAGFVDSIAGGGGLLVVPALLAAGLPPQDTLATTKLQASFGSFSAALHFLRKGYVTLREMAPTIFFTVLGATGGTLLIQRLDAGFLSDVLPFLLVGVAAYMALSPRAGDIETARRLRPLSFAALFGLSIGFYDGFFGPGTGSFWAIAYVGLMGYTLTRATASTKVANFASNIVALFWFAVGGHVAWQLGLLMGVGQFVGARLGSGLVMRNGAKIVRPLLIVMSLLIVARLVWQDEDGAIRQGVAAIGAMF